MTVVVEIGRTHGFNKIKCASTLCSVAHLTLFEAQRLVNAIDVGATAEVVLGSLGDAEQLIGFLQFDGATARRI
jgi:hypothetical protein